MMLIENDGNRKFSRTILAVLLGNQLVLPVYSFGKLNHYRNRNILCNGKSPDKGYHRKKSY